MAAAFSVSSPTFFLPCNHANYRRAHAYPIFQRHRFFPRMIFSSFKNNNNTPPEKECPVPLEQQPINEYQSLSGSFPFSWASADTVEYSSRLLAMGACFAVFLGLPVTWIGSAGPRFEPIRLVFGAVSSGLFVVILAVVRMYLGWAYVGNRLLSATVEYEETGWYDGQIMAVVNFYTILFITCVIFLTKVCQYINLGSNYSEIWVKTAEVLARDRLLGSFSVKPVLGRLKNTLLVLGLSLYICMVFLFDFESGQKYSNIASEEPGGRAIPGVYNEESARSFEPDAFCGESSSP